MRLSPPNDPNLTNRRTFLLGISATMAGLAGCSSLLGGSDGIPLADVVVINALDGRGSGSIEVTDSANERVLDDRFDPDGGAELPPDGDVDDDQAAQYEDVLTTSGTYTVSVELDEESKIDGTPAVDAEIDVTSPDEEHVMVAVGGEETAEPIAIAVIKTINDITDWDSCAKGC